MTQFVILDRDGVINEDSPDYIKSADEWIPVPGSLNAIARLCDAGIQVFVATNQAGIARGKLTLDDLIDIHERMNREITTAGGAITEIQYCPHHPDDACECRKPKPGMLNNLAKAHDLDLSQGYFVGDSLKDLMAGEAAGCTAVLVLTGNGKETQNLRPRHEHTYASLSDFVDRLLSAAG